MDQPLRCNDLKCRTTCTDRAVVTTCSHVFCLDCANRLGLSAPRGDRRECPACSSALPNPDDAVIAQLNPSEDYKTSILSGLSPSVIMECASRGLAFWNYQMAQEIIYQGYLATNLAEKHKSLSHHLDTTIRDCNAEMKDMQTKTEALLSERQIMEERYHKVEAALRKKTQDFHNVDKMYRSLKQQLLLPDMGAAVDTQVDDYLHGTTTNGKRISSASHRRAKQTKAIGSDGSGLSREQPQRGRAEPWAAYPGLVSRAGVGTARSFAVQPLGPSVGRQPLPGHTGYDALRQGTPALRASGSYDGHGLGHSPSPRGVGGVGTGVRVGRPLQSQLPSRAGGEMRMSGLGVSGLNVR